MSADRNNLEREVNRSRSVAASFIAEGRLHAFLTALNDEEASPATERSSRG